MPGPDNLGFAHVHEGRMNMILSSTLYSRLRGQMGQLFKCLEKARPAVGVPGIVDGIDADENVLGSEHFTPTQCEGKEYRVPRGDVGDGYLGRHLPQVAALRHLDVGGESGAANRPEVEAHERMMRNSQ